MRKITMERIKINTSIPAILTDFEQTGNEQFSRAKLKVFYIGETADKRLFTEDFSKSIVKSLPYTPVVSHYDKEKEDFVGHAEQQNIYGIVDPLIKPTFEEIEGKTWAVCGVVLYTERPDETGEIASKIVGKPHSLELNPKTIQYKLNYDKYRKLKNIEFTSGEFVGVSVLGSDQQPAFTGSGFFAMDADFSNKMDLLKNYLKNCAEENRMDARILNFVELSWGEKTSKLYDALDATYGNGCTWIVDMYDEYLVCHLYHPETESCELVKVNYSFDDNGECTLGTVVPVRVVYEEVKEPNPNASLENGNGENGEPTEPVASGEGEAPVSGNAQVEEGAAASEPPVDGLTNAEENPANSEPEGAGEGEGNAEPTNEPANLENQPAQEGEPLNPSTEDLSNATTTAEQTNEPNKEGVDGQSDTSTFTESEKAELEALRRNEKVNLVNSYASDLGEEVIAKYLADVDNFTKDELELALLKQYRELEKTAKKPTMKAFRIINENNTNSRRTIEELVAQYKNKN